MNVIIDCKMEPTFLYGKDWMKSSKYFHPPFIQTRLLTIPVHENLSYMPCNMHHFGDLSNGSTKAYRLELVLTVYVSMDMMYAF